jgi:hypothetical protein
MSANVMVKNGTTKECPSCHDDVSEEEYNEHMKAHALSLEEDPEWQDVFGPEP